MMLTLFHAPRSRSTRIIWLLEELAIPYTLSYVAIRYMDGTGDGPDPANPHPDGKVPALLHDDALVTESAAIAVHLADLAASGDAALAPPIGHPDRGGYLTWLSWTEGEFGPAIFQRRAAGDTPSPAFTAAMDRLDNALARGPYLLGERFSAADVMLGATLGWAHDLLPADGAIPAYLTRLANRPAFARAMARDAAPPAV
ncbi:glutathione S-transferase [Sphingomonas insulae]|uniref:Glutathione S-transferase n=1 Tax=Sphingomonas insulae TaxID=424800 RepID=A0ABN1HZ09_9SPHN|nr:glutathione S-transferase family protein [Sphingomonas insulae]NIJ28828.1 glutathione S-transferase [Sphingomonas insulae]